VHRRWAGRLDAEAVDAKGRSDFVSRADHEAQEAALAPIRRRHPEHPIMAEEDDPEAAPGEDDTSASPDEAGDDPVWIVDPLDGTTNFLHGHPMYAVSVAVAVRGRPVVGVVACATSGERWWATRGGGAFKSGVEPHDGFDRPGGGGAGGGAGDGGVHIRVSGIRDLERALIGTGFPFKAPEVVERYMTQLRRVLGGTAGVRRGGAAALDLCYLAEGRFDGFWELILNPWDFAAGVLIVEEAGGLMATAEGDRPLPLRPGGLVGANSEALLDRLLELLR